MKELLVIIFLNEGELVLWVSGKNNNSALSFYTDSAAPFFLVVVGNQPKHQNPKETENRKAFKINVLFNMDIASILFKTV